MTAPRRHPPEVVKNRNLITVASCLIAAAATMDAIQDGDGGRVVWLVLFWFVLLPFVVWDTYRLSRKERP